MNSQADTLSVFQLNQRLSEVIARASDVRNVWVVGETCDVRTSGGHCYLELVEKDENGGNRSRIRAIIWAGVYRSLAQRFYTASGTAFTSGIKVRVRVAASYHPSFGMSVTVNDIDPAYTAGDALRRRAEIIAQLTSEGVLDMNKTLNWPRVANRVAVVSARGAAGYGDFLDQLLNNAARYRFDVELFEAVMQGQNTVSTVLGALTAIADRSDDFDVVVIIRGGGSTSDLSAFDNYDLAAAVAQFPLPVIVGIGHERDVTVLDYVANTRVKTPTAAAELLNGRIASLFEALNRAAINIQNIVLQRTRDNRELLAHAEALVPGAAKQVISRNFALLERYSLGIASTVHAAVTSRKQDLNHKCEDIKGSVRRALERNIEILSRYEQLLRVLSPEAVLARGFSLTMLADGTIIRKASQVSAGTKIVTKLADGQLTSQIIPENKN